MTVKLKPLNEQVIVLAGASSGIGLATARMAAARGARVVMASRNEEALKNAVNEIRAKGGHAEYCVADVANPKAVDKIADTAIEAFGRVDTWVNIAGVSIFGKLTEIPMEEKRRLFDVNFWGTVNGCRVAIPLLKEKGGALINIGSVLSETAFPLQGIYVASKHAVRGYTDSLRMEIEREGLPISVTLIKPASINTPFMEHARNHLPDAAPEYPPPVYEPEIVADAILECAHSPHRDVNVGGSGRFMAVMDTLLPTTTEKIIERTMFDQQTAKDKRRKQKDALYSHPSHEGRIHGDYRGHVASSSLYTEAALRPLRTALVSAAVIGLITGTLGWILSNQRT